MRPGPPSRPQRPGRSVFRELLDLATPIIGLNVLTILALAVDTAMCGRLPDAETALTGLGFATQVSFLLMVAMIGLSIGSVSLVARAHGAGMDKRVDHILRQSSLLTVGLSILVATLGNAVAAPILKLLGATGPDLEAGLRYLRPMLVGTVFTYLNILYAAVLRGVGNTRLPFVVSLASNSLNVLLNYGLILGHWGLPALGLLGAAIGTVASNAFSLAALFVILRRGAVRGLRPSLRPAPLDRELARDLYRIGAPAAADMVVLNAAFLSIVGMLGRIDPLAVAAHGMGLRIQAIAFVPGMSVSQASAALIGQALGKGRVEEAKQVVRAAMALSGGLMTTLGLSIVAFAVPIVQLFDIRPGTELMDYSVLWLRLLGYGLPIVGVYIALVGMMQGAGATKLSLRINMVATLAFQIPGSWILGFPLGLSAFGVWVAFPLAFVVKAGLGLWVYKRGNWARTGWR